jgi:hypothetical protein
MLKEIRDVFYVTEDYYIPAHRVEFVKRLPLFSFPAAWNIAPGEKLNPRQFVSKSSKESLDVYSLIQLSQH